MKVEITVKNVFRVVVVVVAFLFYSVTRNEFVDAYDTFDDHHKLKLNLIPVFTFEGKLILI